MCHTNDTNRQSVDEDERGAAPEIFEWWVEHFLIPDMIAKGKRVLVLDNARPHRKNVLRALLAAAGLEVWFLP